MEYRPLKVLTLNIAHGRRHHGHQIFLSQVQLLKNIGFIAKVLRRESADLVALQEVDTRSFWHGGLNLLEMLAERARYPWASFGPHMQQAGLCYGTALLSRLPIGDHQSHAFVARALPPKGFVVSRFLWPGTPDLFCDVVSLHLHFARARYRHQQVLDIARTLGHRNSPRIVMGDFNATFTDRSSAVRQIAEALRLETADPFHDGGHTFRFRRKRWDWILASSDFEFRSYRVLDDMLSDHRAVVAEIVPRVYGRAESGEE